MEAPPPSFLPSVGHQLAQGLSYHQSPQYPHVKHVIHTATIHSILHQTMHEVPLWWPEADRSLLPFVSMTTTLAALSV